jgi:FkbM family methyltransferase
MGIMDYLKASFSRKIARRVFKKYEYKIDKFDLSNYGAIEFANWQNPLIKPYVLTSRELDFFKELIPEGSFVIDVGAHIGSITVPMALAAGKDGTVLALEPNPQVFEGLTLNSKLNNGKYNIIPLQYGAADVESEFLYASSEASLSNGGLVSDQSDRTIGRHRLSQPVKTVKLSKLLTEKYENILPKLSFIKIDAEGFDLMIIKDLIPIFKKFKPIVSAEVYFSKTKSLTREECNEMFTVLDDIGYAIYNVENFEKSAAIEEVTRIPIRSKEDMPMGHTYNIFAMPKS